MDFLKIADHITKFESLLLRNSMKMDAVLNKLDLLERKIVVLGKITKNCFSQTKTVINELSKRQLELGEGIDSMNGVVQSHQWLSQ